MVGYFLLPPVNTSFTKNLQTCHSGARENEIGTRLMTRRVKAKAQAIERANQRAVVLGLTGFGLIALLLLLARSWGPEALRLISP